jgi:hypothetical protein
MRVQQKLRLGKTGGRGHPSPTKAKFFSGGVGNVTPRNMSNALAEESDVMRLGTIMRGQRQDHEEEEERASLSEFEARGGGGSSASSGSASSGSASGSEAPGLKKTVSMAQMTAACGTPA